MQPFFNVMADGASVPVLGIGDGIAHVLNEHLQEWEVEKARGSGKGHGDGLRKMDYGIHVPGAGLPQLRRVPLLIYRTESNRRRNRDDYSYNHRQSKNILPSRGAVRRRRQPRIGGYGAGSGGAGLGGSELPPLSLVRRNGIRPHQFPQGKNPSWPWRRATPLSRW